jgi:hypothetical protein
MMIKYYKAIHLLRLTDNDDINEAGGDIDAHVNELNDMLRQACADATRYKLQRDTERKKRLCRRFDDDKETT